MSIPGKLWSSTERRPDSIATALSGPTKVTTVQAILLVFCVVHCTVISQVVASCKRYDSSVDADHRTSRVVPDKSSSHSSTIDPRIRDNLSSPDQMASSNSFGGFSNPATIQVRTSTIIRQAFFTTAIVIGGIFLLVHFVNMLRRKNKAKSKSAQSSYKVFGEGLNFEQQSIQYKDNPVERMSRLLEDTKTLATHQFDNVLTMCDVFERGHQVSNNGKCLGRTNLETKSVDWITYKDVLTRTKHFADGLLQLGFKTDNKSCLGIYSANCPEYVIAEYGSYLHSIIVVPIYDTLGTNVASFISNQAELSCITCDKADRVDRVIEQASHFTTLKHIILMSSNQVTEQLRAKVTASGFQLHTMTEVEQLGAQHPQCDHKPSVNDLAIICYTSGTTSVPKGVMLTHENVVASVATISIHLMDQHATVEDIMISILPLAHMFQRIGEASVFCEGGKVAYYSGDIQQLAAEIQIIRPTIMLAVPRLLNRIYDAIYSKVRGNFIKKTLLRLAYHSKRKDLERHVIRTDTIWDWLVFSKVRANLGGRVRLICVGSAPLSHNVLDFLRCALGCVISEGYGQTECVGPCTATLMGDYTTGHIGPPLVGSLVKLADFADMGYYAAQGKGEILVKGPVVFQGYYKMPDKTAEALDAEGWLHTGDIGIWTEEGTLRLIDRKKNIFKLSQGEYIAPEKIENVLINSRFVTQIFVYGESLKSVLVAIVVPDLLFIASLTNPKLKSIDLGDVCSLNKTPMKEAILNDLQRLGKRAGLKSFELPKSIYVHPDPFTIEQGLLTPTLKSKRNEISKCFRSEIDSMYGELESANN